MQVCWYFQICYVQGGYYTKKVRSSARKLWRTFRCACIPLMIVVSVFERTARKKYDHTYFAFLNVLMHCDKKINEIFFGFIWSPSLP